MSGQTKLHVIALIPSELRFAGKMLARLDSKKPTPREFAEALAATKRALYHLTLPDADEKYLMLLAEPEIKQEEEIADAQK